MKSALIASLALTLAPAVLSHAEVLNLLGQNSGNYWYERSNWTGGSSTDSGFVYGDANGLIHVQRNYQYYGGADRYWQTKAIYFQIDLTPLDGKDVESAVFNFYVTANNSPAQTYLRHLDTQTVLANGDAGQKLSGGTDVAGTGSFTLGWNSIDVTSYIRSDLDKGYGYCVFSIPEFGQVQDENRILSMHGASTTAVAEGRSLKPYLSAVVPEASSYALLATAAACGFAVISRRRRA